MWVWGAQGWGLGRSLLRLVIKPQRATGMGRGRKGTPSRGDSKSRGLGWGSTAHSQACWRPGRTGADGSLNMKSEDKVESRRRVS